MSQLVSTLGILLLLWLCFERKFKILKLISLSEKYRREQIYLFEKFVLIFFCAWKREKVQLKGKPDGFEIKDWLIKRLILLRREAQLIFEKVSLTD